MPLDVYVIEYESLSRFRKALRTSAAADLYWHRIFRRLIHQIYLLKLKNKKLFKLQ